MRFEGRFIELSIAEGGEGRGAALHGRNEALLAHDNGGDVVVPGFPDEVQAYFRLAPHRVERIVPHQKACDGLVHAIAGDGQIPGLGCRAKGRPQEIDRACDWLRPDGNDSHHMVDLRAVGDEAVLLDKVAGELGESIALTVAVKYGSKD